jgi:hypothetical protein
MVVRKESTIHTRYKVYVVQRQKCDCAFNMAMETDLGIIEPLQLVIQWL